MFIANRGSWEGLFAVTVAVDDGKFALAWNVAALTLCAYARGCTCSKVENILLFEKKKKKLNIESFCYKN